MMSLDVTKTMGYAPPIPVRKKYLAPQRPSIKELMQKYERPPSVETIKANKPKSPKLLSKSKVKQMASMFNNKMSQIIRCDSDASKYSTLVKEFSPEAKPITKPLLPKPLPLPPPRLYRNKEKAPIPSPRAKSKAKIPENDVCFVAEDIFAKLTVKDKAALYTQFVEDMTKKNSKFDKHAKVIEANVEKEIARGEVINEKQESVKRLLEDLEARSIFPRQVISATGAQRINSMRPTNLKPQNSKPLTMPVKAKEFEDIMEKKISHISTLTITLHSNPGQKRQRRARSLPRRTAADGLLCIEPSHKRNNDEMRTTLPIEAYAPPKKIRRSRAEHLAPNTLFKNQELENLFYTWLNDRHQNEASQMEGTSGPQVMESEIPKSTIDKLLEEAIAKLETVEIKQMKDSSSLMMNELKIVEENLEIKPNIVKTDQALGNVPKPTPRKKRRAPLGAQSKPVLSSENSTTSSTATSTKHSEAEESESGLCPLSKSTTDESQAENKGKANEDEQNEFQFQQPLKPLRKKKMRRSLTWKKDSTLVEAKTLPTTDSESDTKVIKPTTKKGVNKPQPLDLKAQMGETLRESSFGELDGTLMRDVNSPRKIKSAYTLTVFSPPPYSEEDFQSFDNSESKRCESSHSWPSLVENQLEKDLSYVGKSSSTEMQESDKKSDTPRSLADSFDQGFETGSNEMDSPVRPVRKSNIKRQNRIYSPLFIKLSSDSSRNSIETSSKMENPACFSTPIKEQTTHNFNENHSGVQQQLFSPISQPYKNRRRSVYESESRRTSLTMQVIREDQPLESHEIQSPRSLTTTGMFFANAPTLDMTDLTGINPQKTSSFWIKSGDFQVTMEIIYNDAERLKVLYEIFSQKSCDYQDLHFGIDDHKFSVHEVEEQANVCRRLPESNDKSHYWFSTGDLAIPFSGKKMSVEKIERLFQFIKSSVEETGIIRFGVDNIEFSNVTEFWSQLPKFSIESNYSMLVGLQSGTSNGLEGRSKYAWPHTKPVPVSDLDQSDYECEDFGENESGRLSFSPFGSNQFDLASLGSEELMMPHNGNAMQKSPESFYMEFENEPLDRLFDEKYSHLMKSELSAPQVPNMLHTFQQQQQRLSSVQERISSYNQPANLTSDALDALKGTPEYVAQLKSIVSDISKVGCIDGFKGCDLEQLERYMFFLSRYADICLNSCSDHMDKVLDAMIERKRAIAS